jgi:hypothetical protein
LLASKDDEKAIELETTPDWTEFRDKVLALSQVLERMNLTEYITYLNNPRKLLLINLGVGLLRGLGGVIGATILAGILLMFLKRLVLLNLPVIGGVIGEIVKMVNAHNGY